MYDVCIEGKLREIKSVLSLLLIHKFLLSQILAKQKKIAAISKIDHA